MNNDYGVLGLNSKSIAIIVIVAVVTLLIAILLYLFGRTLPGAIVHLASFTLAVVVMISWLTSVTDWNTDGAFGAVVGSGVLLFIWLGAG